MAIPLDIEGNVLWDPRFGPERQSPQAQQYVAEDSNAAKLGKHVAELQARCDPKAEAIIQDIENRARLGQLQWDVVDRVKENSKSIMAAITAARNNTVNSARRFLDVHQLELLIKRD